MGYQNERLSKYLRTSSTNHYLLNEKPRDPGASFYTMRFRTLFLIFLKIFEEGKRILKQEISKFGGRGSLFRLSVTVASMRILDRKRGVWVFRFSRKRILQSRALFQDLASSVAQTIGNMHQRIDVDEPF